MPPGQTPQETPVATLGTRKAIVYACEDSAFMREYLVSGLDHFGIHLLGLPDGRALDQAIQEQEPDIVLLDIGLPGEDGFSIAGRLHREYPRIGIIMLTSRDRVDDRVQGLDCGADLYFAKPVVIRELASAIGSLYRRLSLPVAPADSWRLDALHSCLVTPAGTSVDLTDNELRYLTPLLEHPGEVVDRDELIRALDQKPDFYAMRRMETMVSRLRTKVQKASPGETLPLRARHGRGYVFLSAVEAGIQ